MPIIDDTGIWDAMLSLYNTHAIAIGLELDIFEALQDPASPAELARTQGYSLRGMTALLPMLKMQSLLDCHQGKYQLNNLSHTYMLKASPYYWGPFFSRTAGMLPNYTICLENIRDGETREERSAADSWESGEMAPEVARSVTDYMHCHSMASAVGLAESSDFSEVKSLLDVGGGSGCYAAAIANANPAISCTVMELAPVCQVADEYIDKAGVADRVHTQAVDMFREDWPEGYDAHFFANIFHDWSIETCQDLANKSFAALAPGGRICLQEILLADSGDAPKPAVAFSFLMTWGTKGQQFSLPQLAQILANAGFSNIRAQRSFGYYSLVTAEKPIP